MAPATRSSAASTPRTSSTASARAPGRSPTGTSPADRACAWTVTSTRGYIVPPYYDSMIGKLIAFGKDRAEAIRRMEIALEEMIVEGIKTTIPFHRLALRHPRFRPATSTRVSSSSCSKHEAPRRRGAMRARVVTTGPARESPRTALPEARSRRAGSARWTGVAIDVLRATTHADASRCENGAARVVPVRRPGRGDRMPRRAPGALACGERDGRIVPGFDLRQLAVRSTRASASRAARWRSPRPTARARCSRWRAAGSAAARRVRQRLRGRARARRRADRVRIVCAGKEGAFALEDAACAGWIVRGCSARAPRPATTPRGSWRRIAPRDAGRGARAGRGLRSTAADPAALGREYARDVALLRARSTCVVAVHAF